MDAPTQRRRTAAAYQREPPRFHFLDCLLRELAATSKFVFRRCQFLVGASVFELLFGIFLLTVLFTLPYFSDATNSSLELDIACGVLRVLGAILLLHAGAARTKFSLRLYFYLFLIANLLLILLHQLPQTFDSDALNCQCRYSAGLDGFSKCEFLRLFDSSLQNPYADPQFHPREFLSPPYGVDFEGPPVDTSLPLPMDGSSGLFGTDSSAAGSGQFGNLAPHFRRPPVRPRRYTTMEGLLEDLGLIEKPPDPPDELVESHKTIVVHHRQTNAGGHSGKSTSFAASIKTKKIEKEDDDRAQQNQAPQGIGQQGKVGGGLAAADDRTSQASGSGSAAMIVRHSASAWQKTSGPPVAATTAPPGAEAAGGAETPGSEPSEVLGGAGQAQEEQPISSASAAPAGGAGADTATDGALSPGGGVAAAGPSGPAGSAEQAPTESEPSQPLPLQPAAPQAPAAAAEDTGSDSPAPVSLSAPSGSASATVTDPANAGSQNIQAQENVGDKSKLLRVLQNLLWPASSASAPSPVAGTSAGTEAGPDVGKAVSPPPPPDVPQSAQSEAGAAVADGNAAVGAGLAVQQTATAVGGPVVPPAEPEEQKPQPTPDVTLLGIKVPGTDVQFPIPPAPSFMELGERIERGALDYLINCFTQNPQMIDTLYKSPSMMTNEVRTALLGGKCSLGGAATSAAAPSTVTFTTAGVGASSAALTPPLVLQQQESQQQAYPPPAAVPTPPVRHSVLVVTSKPALAPQRVLLQQPEAEKAPQQKAEVNPVINIYAGPGGAAGQPPMMSPGVSLGGNGIQVAGGVLPPSGVPAMIYAPTTTSPLMGVPASTYPGFGYGWGAPAWNYEVPGTSSPTRVVVPVVASPGGSQAAQLAASFELKLQELSRKLEKRIDDLQQLLLAQRSTMTVQKEDVATLKPVAPAPPQPQEPPHAQVVLVQPAPAAAKPPIPEETTVPAATAATVVSPAPPAAPAPVAAQPQPQRQSTAAPGATVATPDHPTSKSIDASPGVKANDAAAAANESTEKKAAPGPQPQAPRAPVPPTPPPTPPPPAAATASASSSKDSPRVPVSTKGQLATMQADHDAVLFSVSSKCGIKLADETANIVKNLNTVEDATFLQRHEGHLERNDGEHGSSRRLETITRQFYQFESNRAPVTLQDGSAEASNQGGGVDGKPSTYWLTLIRFGAAGGGSAPEGTSPDYGGLEYVGAGPGQPSRWFPNYSWKPVKCGLDQAQNQRSYMISAPYFAYLFWAKEKTQVPPAFFAVVVKREEERYDSLAARAINAAAEGVAAEGKHADGPALPLPLWNIGKETTDEQENARPIPASPGPVEGKAEPSTEVLVSLPAPAPAPLAAVVVPAPSDSSAGGARPVVVGADGIGNTASASPSSSSSTNPPAAAAPGASSTAPPSTSPPAAPAETAQKQNEKQATEEQHEESKSSSESSKEQDEAAEQEERKKPAPASGEDPDKEKVKGESKEQDEAAKQEVNGEPSVPEDAAAATSPPPAKEAETSFIQVQQTEEENRHDEDPQLSRDSFFQSLRTILGRNGMLTHSAVDGIVERLANDKNFKPTPVLLDDEIVQKLVSKILAHDAALYYDTHAVFQQPHHRRFEKVMSSSGSGAIEVGAQEAPPNFDEPIDYEPNAEGSSTGTSPALVTGISTAVPIVPGVTTQPEPPASSTIIGVLPPAPAPFASSAPPLRPSATVLIRPMPKIATPVVTAATEEAPVEPPQPRYEATGVLISTEERKPTNQLRLPVMPVFSPDPKVPESTLKPADCRCKSPCFAFPERYLEEFDQHGDHHLTSKSYVVRLQRRLRSFATDTLSSWGLDDLADAMKEDGDRKAGRISGLYGTTVSENKGTSPASGDSFWKRNAGISRTMMDRRATNFFRGQTPDDAAVLNALVSGPAATGRGDAILPPLGERASGGGRPRETARGSDLIAGMTKIPLAVGPGAENQNSNAGSLGVSGVVVAKTSNTVVQEMAGVPGVLSTPGGGPQPPPTSSPPVDAEAGGVPSSFSSFLERLGVRTKTRSAPAYVQMGPRYHLRWCELQPDSVAGCAALGLAVVQGPNNKFYSRDACSRTDEFNCRCSGLFLTSQPASEQCVPAQPNLSDEWKRARPTYEEYVADEKSMQKVALKQLNDEEKRKKDPHLHAVMTAEMSKEVATSGSAVSPATLLITRAATATGSGGQVTSTGPQQTTDDSANAPQQQPQPGTNSGPATTGTPGAGATPPNSAPGVEAGPAGAGPVPSPSVDGQPLQAVQGLTTALPAPGGAQQGNANVAKMTIPRGTIKNVIIETPSDHSISWYGGDDQMEAEQVPSNSQRGGLTLSLLRNVPGLAAAIMRRLGVGAGGGTPAVTAPSSSSDGSPTQPSPSSFAQGGTSDTSRDANLLVHEQHQAKNKPVWCHVNPENVCPDAGLGPLTTSGFACKIERRSGAEGAGWNWNPAVAEARCTNFVLGLRIALVFGVLLTVLILLSSCMVLVARVSEDDAKEFGADYIADVWADGYEDEDVDDVELEDDVDGAGQEGGFDPPPGVGDGEIDDAVVEDEGRDADEVEGAQSQLTLSKGPYTGYKKRVDDVVESPARQQRRQRMKSAELSSSSSSSSSSESDNRRGRGRNRNLFYGDPPSPRLQNALEDALHLDADERREEVHEQLVDRLPSKLLSTRPASKEAQTSSGTTTQSFRPQLQAQAPPAASNREEDRQSAPRAPSRTSVDDRDRRRLADIRQRRLSRGHLASGAELSASVTTVDASSVSVMQLEAAPSINANVVSPPRRKSLPVAPATSAGAAMPAVPVSSGGGESPTRMGNRMTPSKRRAAAIAASASATKGGD